MIDYLDEDPVISSQKYAILSYVITDKSPMVKFRGAYSSVEECASKIKRLQNIDQYFHMFIVEVGKWGALLTEEELEKQQIDKEFINDQMNDMMKKYKEEKTKANDEFEKRKRSMVENAIKDGTKEGQEALSSKKEHVISVRDRLKSSEEIILQINSDLEKYAKIYQETKEKLSTYTEDEIKEAEKIIEKLNNQK